MSKLRTLDYFFEKGFDSVRCKLESKKISRLLFIASLASISLSPLYPNSFTIFFSVDVQKIAYFASGVSPYSSNPWAAPYPPFFFVVWAGVYLFLKSILFEPASLDLGIRVVSALVVILTSFVIYHAVRTRESKNFSMSIAAIFLSLACVADLLPLNGDSFGLLMVAAASSSFLRSKKSSLGVALLSAGFAFKIHPALALILVVTTSFLISRRLFLKNFTVAFSVIVALFFVPIALIPDAEDVVFSYTANTLQLYSFSVYSGILDLSDHFEPEIFVSLSQGLNFAFLVSLIATTAFLCCALLRFRIFGSAKPVDVLCLGAMIWLIILKQLLQHYAMWAFIPLLVAGRWKSSFYLITGEIAGSSLWGLGLLHSLHMPLTVSPDPLSSLLFFSGGMIFTFFDLLAIRKLLQEIRAESLEEKRSLVSYQRIQFSN